MTQETKHGFEIAGNWLTKALLGVCIYFLVDLVQDIKATREQLEEIKIKVTVLESRFDDMSREFRRLSRNDN
jgi:hypothetical protein